MEKPSGRSTSANSKASNSETKGKPESNNKHARIPKHKENIYTRLEQTRRPAPQRNRIIYDKRPRSRGQYGTDRDRSEVTLTEEFGTSVGVKHGNKKLNLNHLLNFTVAPSANSLLSEYRVGGWQTGRSHRKQKLPRYNKEKFLQANCQFIVKEEGDYTVHVTDPDTLVNWELVEEIHLLCHEVPSCPICLYPPAAAKITRCGHIYCWSCLLHYLSLSDRSWRKCPICYESIHKNDLKSVVSMSKAAYQVGDEIVMCLMKRKRDSVIAKPVYQVENSSNTPLSVNDDANCFQKLLLASKDDIRNIIQREHNELKTQLEKEADTPESCFLQLALELLQERRKLLFQGDLIEAGIFELLSLNEKLYNCEEKFHDPQPDLVNDSHQVVEKMADPFSDEDTEMAPCLSPDINDSACISASTNIVCAPPHDAVTNEISSDTQNSPETADSTIPSKAAHQNQGKEYYYFYQAVDGQNIYLNTINVQMLVREFGSLEHCPHKFSAKIVALKGESMDDKNRQRWRYLRHLPLTCEFQVAELELRSPLIHQSTHEAFKGELEKRQRSRREKAKQEKRRERQIEQEEKKKLGKYPGLNYHLDSLQHFPACSQPTDIRSDDPCLPSNSFIGSPQSEGYLSAGLSSSPEQVSDHLPNEKLDTKVIQQTSFAQMLREGMMKQQTAQLSLSNNSVSTTGATSSDEDCSVPPPHQSMGDAIEAALHNMSKTNVSDKSENSVKKKKGKKTVLYTTSFNRRK